MTRTDPPAEVKTGVAVAAELTEDAKVVAPSDVKLADSAETQEDVLLSLKRQLDENSFELRKLKADLLEEVEDVNFFARRVNRHIEGCWILLFASGLILAFIVVSLICQGSVVESARLTLINVTGRLDVLEAPAKAAALAEEKRQMFAAAGLNIEMSKPSLPRTLGVFLNLLARSILESPAVLICLALSTFIIGSWLNGITISPSPNDVRITADTHAAPAVAANPSRRGRRGQVRQLAGGPWPSHPTPVASSSSSNEPAKS